MLEIDDVCRALEASHPWSLADKAADQYKLAIDLATEPKPTPITEIVLARSLQYLDENKVFIEQSLKYRDDIFPGVLGAFVATVDSVKAMAGQQG